MAKYLLPKMFLGYHKRTNAVFTAADFTLKTALKWLLFQFHVLYTVDKNTQVLIVLGVKNEIKWIIVVVTFFCSASASLFQRNPRTPSSMDLDQGWATFFSPEGQIMISEAIKGPHRKLENKCSWRQKMWRTLSVFFSPCSICLIKTHLSNTL